jgi:hypothetical protein
MTITKDTNILIIARDCCLAISEFTKNKYQVVGFFESTLKSAMSLLLPKQSSAVFKQAAHPLFDSISNPRLFALMVLILGFDVYLSGITGVSVTTLAKIIAKEKKEMADTFAEELFWLCFSINSWRRITYHVKQ